MKKFTNPAPYQAEIETINGEKVIVTAQAMTASMMSRIHETSKSAEVKMDIVTAQLSIIFGENQEYWDQFQFQIINSLLLDYMGELANPIKG